MDTNFTAKEKVLVHLLDYYGNEEGYALPVELTQEGIAELLDLKQNTVSYAVRTLVKEGLLREETRRIKNKKQKRKAYFLTEKGFEIGKKTREKMADTEVDVIRDREKSPIKLGEINAYFQTNLSLLEIIRRIENEGSFEPRKEKEDRSFESYLKDLISPAQKEHPKFDEFMDVWEKGEDIISVIGGEGTGKTTLLSKLADEIRENNNVFYFNIKSWHDPMHLWADLSEFLQKCGKHTLSSYLKSADRLEAEERINRFLKDIKDLKTVFIFDDIHTNEKLFEMIDDTISRKEKTDSSRFVMSRESEDTDTSFEDEDEILLDSTNVLLRALKDYYDDPESIDSLGDVLDYHITDEEYWALALLSVFREPVNKKVLSRLEPVTLNMVKNLIDTPLVDITTEEKYIHIHPLIRSDIWNSLISEELTWLHEIASEYYIDEPYKGEKQNIEKLYHTLKAKKYGYFKEMMDEEGNKILNKGYYDTIILLIEEFERKDKDPFMTFIKAEGYRRKNLYEQALGLYSKIIDSDEEPSLTARAHIGSASTKELQGEYDEAFFEYDNAREATAKIENKSKREKLIGKILFRQGYLLSEIGEYSEAEELLCEALDTLKEGEHSLLATAHFVMARIKKLNGDLDRSIHYFGNGLKHWQQIKETYQRIGGLKEIGSFYTILRELNSAEEYLKEAIDTSERFGYWDLKASALISLTECYLEKRKIEEAIQTGKEAKELLEDLEDETGKALAHTLLGNAYTISDRMEKAEEHYNKSISLYQKMGASYKLGLAYFSMAKLHEKKDNKEGVAENYRKAILSFSGSGANWMAKRVEKEMESIPISM
ncbi:MAG: AAA family ATPase [Candidatus Natronoplasma sp.]